MVGAGAIGGVIGAFLARGGRKVELVDVVDQHVQAINEKGLAIIEAGEILTAKVKAYTPFELLQKNEKLECVILCVKCQDTKGALLPLIPLIDDNSYVLSLQNGLCEIEIAALVLIPTVSLYLVNGFIDPLPH